MAVKKGNHSSQGLEYPYKEHPAKGTTVEVAEGVLWLTMPMWGSLTHINLYLLEDDDAWLIYSEGLSDAGLLAMEAAAEQNEEDFFQAGAQLYSVCTACHQAYNPDINSRFVDGSAE